MGKFVVCLLFGGKSAEHEVSVCSAANVAQALDRRKYDVVAVYVSKQGKWYVLPDINELRQEGQPRALSVAAENELTLSFETPGQPFKLLSTGKLLAKMDCVLPILHGTYGEDGCMQGLLDILGLPYVGSGVLGSAICMSKHVTKKILRAANLPVVDFSTIRHYHRQQVTYSDIQEKFGKEVFVKPSCLGSSVGIAKVGDEKSFYKALDEAFAYDDVVIVEPYIKGREIEISVLGNENPIVSLPGEIVTNHDFYSYQAKYLDVQGAQLFVPAMLSKTLIDHFQSLAKQAFQVLECRGMARVDFFLAADNQILLNEVNTIPGFTNISMYPKLWSVSGLQYSELIDNLIQLAVSHFYRKQQLKTDFPASENTKDAPIDVIKGSE